MNLSLMLKKSQHYTRSSRFMKVTIEEAKSIIQAGGIIAYPTETTFGLGCDAFNKTALERLNAIKQRSKNKGFITLIHNYEQLKLLTPPLSETLMHPIRSKWPGPYTFVFPAHLNLPALLTGSRNSIAIRMSSHPIAHELSKNAPITSTSANISTQKVLTTLKDIETTFNELIDGIIDVPPHNTPPSRIIDAISGECFR